MANLNQPVKVNKYTDKRPVYRARKRAYGADISSQILRVLSLIIVLTMLPIGSTTNIQAASISGLPPDPNGIASENTGDDDSATEIVFLPIIFPGYKPPVLTGDGDWPMAGANPERTSWTAEEVRGDLTPEWYVHIDAYISQKVQIIAANDTLFISAADGLHALDSNSGAERWYYPTNLPLGHSPTYANGIVYVGGFDKNIHAIDATNGQPIWTYPAEAGFHTNPLVVNGMLYAGNRDGYLYAIYTEGSQAGQLAWRFKTDGPILNSAAFSNEVVYFASNDMHAYALDAGSGNLLWKSGKLPGFGFHSFWPVVYRDYVIFSGSWNYRLVAPGPSGNHNLLERLDVYPEDSAPGDPVGPYGTESGDWMPGTTTINASAITEYFEQKPHRRTFFMLNRANGEEYTFDYDSDGNAEYAPILFFGPKDGTRYPPAVGPDGVIYQANNYINSEWIPRGHVSGWKLGTPFISIPTDETNAVDEPIGYSIGGSTIYWKRCCDRKAGAFSLFENYDVVLFDEGNPLRRYIPGLFEEGWEYAYWKHGDTSPPIPYNGRLYTINNNGIVAFSEFGGDPVIPPDEYRGTDTGIDASEIERATTITGLNTKITLDSSSWPLAIQQERYFEIREEPETRARYFSLFEVKGSESTSPTNLGIQSTNITTRLTSTFEGSQTLETWVSQRSPTILFENTSSLYKFQGSISGIAYPTASGVQVRSGAATLNGSDLSEGWLLVWDHTLEHRWAPVVISLQNQPSQIALDESGLRLTYPTQAGYLSVTPLYGMSQPKSYEESSWLASIPGETISRIQLINRTARAVPNSSSDSLTISNQTGDAELTYTYQFLTYQDAWGTSPLRIAYLPTHLALAAWNSSPIRINGQPLEQWTDLTYLTPLGRVAGVADSDTVSVVLPVIANYWKLPPEIPSAPEAGDPLQNKLITEIQKMLDAGHLRPGYGRSGIWDAKATGRIGHYLPDEWHNPAETIYTLISAIPLLPVDLQSQVRQYVQNEFQVYPPYEISHIGWADGASREYFDLPPEVDADRVNFLPCGDCSAWGFPPENHYASWLYAAQFGNATAIFNGSQDMLDTTPVLKQSAPYSLNSYITGYIGYLRLAELANAGPQPQVEQILVDLLIQRAAMAKYPNALEQTGFEYSGYKWSLRTYSPNMPDTLFLVRTIGTLWSQMPLYGYQISVLYGLSGPGTGGAYQFGIDYVNLVPELADFLLDYSYLEVQQSVEDYERRAPYWFVTHAEEAAGESQIRPIYDVIALYQAKAMILNNNRSELEKYLDVPATRVGDLYHIQKLIGALSASN